MDDGLPNYEHLFCKHPDSNSTVNNYEDTPSRREVMGQGLYEDEDEEDQGVDGTGEELDVDMTTNGAQPSSSQPAESSKIVGNFLFTDPDSL